MFKKLISKIFIVLLFINGFKWFKGFFSYAEDFIDGFSSFDLPYIFTAKDTFINMIAFSIPMILLTFFFFLFFIFPKNKKNLNLSKGGVKMESRFSDL